jgi:thiol-disulfide isomerase/thioredoxin
VIAVRSALAGGNPTLAQAELQSYRTRFGNTPQALEALSWLGRWALSARQYDQALAYAGETRKLAAGLLQHRPLDAEPHLPLALGASIEVQADAMAAQGRRAEAVTFLNGELKAWHGTSIHTRIQKNINLLSLEGKPAPPLDLAHWLGPKPPPMTAWRGHPVLLFFWAHWCPDCKQEALDIARLEAAYRGRGLIVIGPTRHYGYAAGGEEAGPGQELQYIEAVRQRYYAALADMPVPVSEENFRVYGASTTPTLVLIDGKGLVRMYHPGAMEYAGLAAQVESCFRQR